MDSNFNTLKHTPGIRVYDKLGLGAGLLEWFS